MPSFLDRLFRRPGKPPEVEAPAPAPSAVKSNPVAIPVPEGMPPELLQRVPTRQPRDPSRKRKRRTKEEIEADHKAWVDGTLHQARVRFEFDRARADSAGATHYLWRISRDSDVCKVCRPRNGKRFPLRGPAEFQHPGFMMCFCLPDDEDEEASEQPCRCYAEFVFPK